MQLCCGGAAQLIHFLLVPETRATILLNREAKRRRAAGGDPRVKGPIEMHGFNMNFKYIMTVWSRPFYMLFTEPIVAWLSSVSGFSDALTFTFLRELSLQTPVCLLSEAAINIHANVVLQRASNLYTVSPYTL